MAQYEYCQVLTSVGSEEAAEALAEGALRARLAAWVQVGGPISSSYWWEGELEATQEWTVTLKTTTARRAALEEYLRAQSTDEVTEVLCTPVTGGNPAYLAWLAKETNSPDPRDTGPVRDTRMAQSGLSSPLGRPVELLDPR